MEARSASSILQIGAIDVLTDLPTALTFDDVLLVPRHSTVIPSQVDVTTRFTRNIQLNVPLASEKPDAAVLYWVGCAASYDQRAKKIARATAQLLQRAGVDFAILGNEETCTGDPARRAGSPVHVSSSPRMAKSTPARCKSCAVARAIFFARWS